MKTYIDLDGHRLTLVFDISEYRPAVPYDKNGDPGWPEEPVEIEVTEVYLIRGARRRLLKDDGKFYDQLAENFADEMIQEAIDTEHQHQQDAAEARADRRRGD